MDDDKHIIVLPKPAKSIKKDVTVKRLIWMRKLRIRQNLLEL
jgi:hypothetical protein